MPQQKLTLQARGLYLNSNPFSEVPEGALSRANDVIIPREGIVESRRGNTTGASFSGAVRYLAGFKGELVAEVGSNVLARLVSGVVTAYSGTYTPPSGYRMRFAEARQNLYFTTSGNTYRLDSLTGTPEKAGGPFAPDLPWPKPSTDNGPTVALVGSSGWFSKNKAVAYRWLLAKKDANGRIIFGAPSARLVRVNPDDQVFVAGKLWHYGATRVLATQTFPLYKHGDVVTLSPGETNFPSGNKTALYPGFDSGNPGFFYDEFGGGASGFIFNTATQTFSSDGRNVQLTLLLPPDATSNYFVQVYRTAMSTTAADDPGDDMGLVYEAQLSSTDVSNGYHTALDVCPDDLRGDALYTNSLQEGILNANLAPPTAKDVANFAGSLFFANATQPHSLTLSLLAAGSQGLQNGNTLTIAGTTYTASDGVSPDITIGQFGIPSTSSGSTSTDIEFIARNLIHTINRYSSNTAVWATYASAEDEAPGKILVFSRTPGGALFSATASANGDSFAPTLPTSGTAVSSTADGGKNRLYFSKPDQPDAVPLLNYLDIGSADAEILRAITLRGALYVFKEDGIWRVTGDGPETFSEAIFDSTVHLYGPESAVAVGNQIFALTSQGVVAVSETGVQVVSKPIEPALLSLFASALSATKSFAFAVGYETEREYRLWLPSSSSDTYATQAYVYNLGTRAWTRFTTPARCGIIHPTEDKQYLGNTASNTVLVERKARASSDYAEASGAGVPFDVKGQLDTGGNPGALKRWVNTTALFEAAVTTATLSWATEISTTPETASGAPVALALSRYVPLDKSRSARLTAGLTHSTANEKCALLGLGQTFNPGSDRQGR